MVQLWDREVEEARGGAEDKEAEESGERREEKELVQRRVQTAGFNQQQAVGNEITIPLRSD